jgi:hypothetical protein
VTLNHQKLPVSRTLWTAIIVSLILAALCVNSYGPLIAIIVLSVWSLFGSKQAIQALSLVVLIKFLNPALYRFSGPVAVWEWIILAVAGSRIFFDSSRNSTAFHSVLPWLLSFSFVVLLESIFFSHDKVVSIFKLASFTYSAVAVLLGFKETARRQVDWTSWFLGVWIAVTFLSVPTYFFHQIGFQKDGMGFQGILNQPQALAVFLAPMVAWLSGKMFLAAPSKSVYWLYFVLPVALVSMFFTRGRTAFFSIGAALIVIGIIALCIRPEWRKWIQKGLFKPITLLCGFALFSLLVLQSSLVMDTVSTFILKGQKGAVTNSFEHSRGKGMIEQWQNFSRYPLFGIGFGVSLDRSFKPILDPTTGLPLSASTEKADLLIATLEETGIIGTSFFLFFLVALIWHILSKTDLVMPWVFFTCLFINVGEMIFFSPGGLGIYIWLLIGWATCHRWETTCKLSTPSSEAPFQAITNRPGILSQKSVA